MSQAFSPGKKTLLAAVLAVVAALMGLAFKTVLYKVEDQRDLAWKNRPEWARTGPRAQYFLLTPAA